MKKIIAIALLGLLIINTIMVAIAEVDINRVLRDYNDYAVIFGADELDADTADLSNNGLVAYRAIFMPDPAIMVAFVSKAGDVIDRGTCQCNDETRIGDFLAYCNAMALYLFGVSESTNTMGSIMHQYMMARGGNETTLALVGNNGALQIEYNNGVFRFDAVLY